MRDLKIYETYDVDLAAFLMLSGLKFVECKLDDMATTPRVLMRFIDEKEAARDLERVFMSSEISKYRTFHKYLLKNIHRTLKGLN